MKDLTTYLTTSEVASRLGVSRPTVTMWCRQGLFPNARAEQTPRGPVWLIPDSDLKTFTRPLMGRTPKPEKRKALKKAAKPKKAGKPETTF